ncbi:MAG: hypothetical protein MI808_11480 [Pseudomonadales bacterium]|nr:hypothetical protein [Pseudomonadales bacterium]
MNIEVITHYYLKDKRPFLSLSDLGGGVDNPVFMEMLNRHKSDPKYKRRFGMAYLDTRREVEEKLRRLFIKRGGKPIRRFPIYFTLGESKWFEGINKDHMKIEIPIASLPENAVSITFPDSYLAMTASSKPYFEKVYHINEIEDILSIYGAPKDGVPDTYERYWEGDIEHYYEVQVWDDDVLKKYPV